MVDDSVLGDWSKKGSYWESWLVVTLIFLVIGGLTSVALFAISEPVPFFFVLTLTLILAFVGAHWPTGAPWVTFTGKEEES